MTSVAKRTSVMSILLIVVTSTLGCSGGTSVPNPSFPLTSEDAKFELALMRQHPKALRRPLVIVGGYLDIGWGPSATADMLEKVIGDQNVLTVSLFWCGDFDDCRAKVIDAVDRAFPDADPAWTTEVDVIGLSMGGLAARYAAAPALSVSKPVGVPLRRLKVARLFTLGTPHLGALLADEVPAIATLHRQMKKGSDFLVMLDRLDGGRTYPIIPYVRVPDRHAGEMNAAPPGEVPIWMPNIPSEDAHLGIPSEPRIIADIGRRLRDERPFATEPRSPLPK